MRTEDLDALMNSAKKMRGEGDLMSLVSDTDRITSTPQRLEDALPLDLKLTPSVDKVPLRAALQRSVPAACIVLRTRAGRTRLKYDSARCAVQSRTRSLLGAGNLDTFDPSLSGLAALFPSTIKAPPSSRLGRPELRRSEFASHITAAVELLNPPEQDRLKNLLRQPTMQGCMESLLNVCSSSASEASRLHPLAAAALGARQRHERHHASHAAAHGVARAAGALRHLHQRAAHLWLVARVPARARRVLGPFTSREADSLGGHPGAAHPHQATMSHAHSQPGNPEYGSALLDQLQEAQRAARRRAGYVDDGGLGSRLVSPRRRKTGPPSSRDKVWDLLSVGEKKQILRGPDDRRARHQDPAGAPRRAARAGGGRHDRRRRLGHRVQAHRVQGHLRAPRQAQELLHLPQVRLQLLRL